MNDVGVDSRKVRVIWNAVDYSVWTPVPAPEPCPPAILVPRRLVIKNGVHILIEAFASVRTALEDRATLLVAGDGPERRRLEELVHALGVSHQVQFLGALSRPEVAATMQRCRAVAIPSIPVAGVVEAASMAALEAMSSGKVIIASAIGGLSELIRNGDTGILCPDGDVEAWGQRLREFFEMDQQSVRGMGDRARQYVIAHHDPDQWAREIKNVYREVARN